MSLALRRRCLGGALVALLVLSSAGGPAIADEHDAPEPEGLAQARLATPVLSVRRAPALVVAGAADERLAADLAPVIAEMPATSCVSVSDGRRVLHRTNGDLPLAPASNQKVPTALALTRHFPDDHRFATVVSAEAEVVDGVLGGDLFLVGGGDPMLVTDGFRVTLTDEPDRHLTDFAALADAIVAAGITEIDGDLVADESRHEPLRYLTTWPERYQRQDVVGPLSALSVNRGQTGLTDAPDQPSPSRSPGDPPPLAAETLRTLLDQRGVIVRGAIRPGTAPRGADEVARIESPPLRDLLAELLAFSDNYSAELLLRELGREVLGQGTTEAGIEVVATTLRDEGIDTEMLRFVDGSGLDEGNRLTCDALVEIFDAEAPDSAVVTELSVSGEVGTLRPRMNAEPLRGRVRAKTGTLNTVMSLAGYVDANTGVRLTFAAIINIPPEGAPGASTYLLDQLAEVLLEHPVRPAPDVVAPLEPHTGA